MRILVTGATGEVGRRFVPRLLRRAAPGDTVRVIVREGSRGDAFAALGAGSSLAISATRATWARPSPAWTPS